MIIIEPKAKQLMSEDALNAFPNECCGFIFGTEEPNGDRLIGKITVVDNSKPGDKTRRFEIAPLDYLRAEQYAEDNQLTLIGVYHSHPRHPAIPSEHDRKAAQPWFSYLIISTLDDRSTHFRSWRLNEQDQFEEEKIADYQFT